MYLTEEEARKKWCPQVREVAVDERVFSTRGAPDDGPYPCIASECMMWRWKRWESRGNVNDIKDEEVLKHGSLGYCGLGGKP